MRFNTASFSFVVVALSLVACTGGGVSTEASPADDTGIPCSSSDDCASFTCSCGAGVVEAGRCEDGFCIDKTRTCASVCGSDVPEDVDSSESPARNEPPVGDQGEGDPCVPVSTSSVAPRTGAIAAVAAAHQAVPPTPANGSVDVTKNSAGKPSRITYNAEGSDADYTDDFTYNSSGLITRFEHNGAGTDGDFTEDFTYNSKGLITRFEHNGAGTDGDFTEDFTYNSSGLLTRFEHNGAGTDGDFTEDFTYNSSGLLTRFEYNGAGTDGDFTEDFTYNSSGLVTRWEYNGSGSSEDSTLDVSYSSSGGQSTLTSHGARASGATVTACK